MPISTWPPWRQLAGHDKAMTRPWPGHVLAMTMPWPCPGLIPHCFPTVPCPGTHHPVPIPCTSTHYPGTHHRPGHAGWGHPPELPHSCPAAQEGSPGWVLQAGVSTDHHHNRPTTTTTTDHTDHTDHCLASLPCLIASLPALPHCLVWLPHCPALPCLPCLQCWTLAPPARWCSCPPGPSGPTRWAHTARPPRAFRPDKGGHKGITVGDTGACHGGRNNRFPPVGRKSSVSHKAGSLPARLTALNLVN